MRQPAGVVAAIVPWNAPLSTPVDKVTSALLAGCPVVLKPSEVAPLASWARCGGVGLNAIQGARLAGASRIIAVDRLAAKLDLATTFGATDVVDASTTDPVEAVRDLSGGGVNHALEVVGIASTIEQAFAMLDARGTATVVGAAPNAQTEVRIRALEFLREKRIQGCVMGSARFRLDIPLYSQLYLDGRLKLDELLSEKVSFDNNAVNTAMNQLDSPLVARAVTTP